LTIGSALQQVRPDNPLIIQGDHIVPVEVDSPRYADARNCLARFAELVKSPEHIHTYRITPLSIWNACAAGVDPAWIASSLQEFAKYPVPGHVAVEIRDQASRYGRLKLTRDADGLVLSAADKSLAEELAAQRRTRDQGVVRAMRARRVSANPRTTCVQHQRRTIKFNCVGILFLDLLLLFRGGWDSIHKN
jgi:hypothetical protein